MENKSKLERIKTRVEFLNLKKTGRRVFPNNWLVVNFKKNSKTHHRVGWTIPKFVGNAVLRNKLKRWSREVLKTENKFSKTDSFDLNFVFRVKEEGFYKKLKFYEFKSSIQKAYSKINPKIKSKS